MGCPVHIWVPVMAAAAPIARVAKDRLNALRYRRATALEAPTGEAVRTQQRWAPIDPHARD